MARRQWFKKKEETSNVSSHKWVKESSKVEAKNSFSRQPRVDESQLSDEEKYEVDEAKVMAEIEIVHEEAIKQMEKHMGGKK